MAASTVGAPALFKEVARWRRGQVVSVFDLSLIVTSIWISFPIQLPYFREPTTTSKSAPVSCFNAAMNESSSCLSENFRNEFGTASYRKPTGEEPMPFNESVILDPLRNVSHSEIEKAIRTAIEVKIGRSVLVFVMEHDYQDSTIKVKYSF